jgi:hypothetical protein
MHEHVEMSRYDKVLWKEINKILFRDWAPIGVNDNPQCENEYENYVCGIYRLVVGGADRTKLTQHLARLETVSMGLHNNPDREQRCRRIAEQILVLWSETDSA